LSDFRNFELVVPKTRVGERPKRGCIWCPKPAAKGRILYCSDACNLSRLCHESWEWTKEYIIWRDKGRCVLCEFDVSKLERIARWLRRWDKDWRDPDVAALYVALGAPLKGYRVFYEIDHILPRKAGGGNEFENLRLLCWPCHSKVTAEYARLRAAGRKGQLLLDHGQVVRTERPSWKRRIQGRKKIDRHVDPWNKKFRERLKHGH
jgi:5-methylcytosine-specific restriction endonuclease McrA